MLMLSDRRQQRTQLEETAPLGPRRVHRAQMHAEDPQRLALRHDLDERVARQPRPMPLRVDDAGTAQVAERLTRERSRVGHASAGRERFDHVRPRRFLENHDVGRTAVDDLRDLLDASGSAALNVVGEQAKRHAGRESVIEMPAGFSNSVRYGCPSRSPRNWITMSRDAWIFTGRSTIAINRWRRGTRSGAISGSSSLNGRECTPGTKKPLAVKNSSAPLPTSVRSRSLVPGPSLSNGALSFQRWPVTALPRRTTVVPSGTTSRMMRQNSSKRSARPPNARRMTFARFSASDRSPCTTSSGTGSFMCRFDPNLAPPNRGRLRRPGRFCPIAWSGCRRTRT